MLRIFIYLFVLSSYLYSCAMCRMQTPNLAVTAKIISEDNKTKFDIEWKFPKDFVDSVKVVYDLNNNGKIEKKERQSIKDNLIDYLKQLSYLTKIQYIPKTKDFNETYIRKIKPYFSKLTIDKEMFYRYKFDLNFKLQKDYKLEFFLDDIGNNFLFHFKDIKIIGYNGYKKLNYNIDSYDINFYKESVAKVANADKNSSNYINVPFKADKQVSHKQNVSMRNVSSDNILYKYFAKISSSLKKILQNIKETNSITSYFWLLAFSFLYGIIHAIGPGHGKTLISSYFLNHEKSYTKALSVSFLIGVVHTFSAFILTLVVYYAIGFMFGSKVANIDYLASKVSAVIIILIALYLIYQKIKKSKIDKSKLKFAKPNQTNFALNTKAHNHTNNLSCGCAACKTTSTDIGVILAAGIVPCPGTVTVFIFTMSLGIYFVGFLSAVFMSLGMSLIIFIMAYLSINVRKKATSNDRLLKFVEYGSLFFILFLGIILFMY